MEQWVFRETSWGTDFGKISLDKIVRLIAYECCEVFAMGTITTRCWACEAHTGVYFERIQGKRPIKLTNPYVAYKQSPGPLGDLPHP